MKDKNKESKLIKKIWKGIDFLVPGSMFCRLDNWKDQSPYRAYWKFLANVVITSGLLGMGINYGTNAFEYGSLDYKKWPEIREERQMQYSHEKQINEQGVYRNQFQELDKNKDYVIDSTEFIYRK